MCRTTRSGKYLPKGPAYLPFPPELRLMVYSYMEAPTLCYSVPGDAKDIVRRFHFEIPVTLADWVARAYAELRSSVDEVKTSSHRPISTRSPMSLLITESQAISTLQMIGPHDAIIRYDNLVIRRRNKRRKLSNTDVHAHFMSLTIGHHSMNSPQTLLGGSTVRDRRKPMKQMHQYSFVFNRLINEASQLLGSSRQWFGSAAKYLEILPRQTQDLEDAQDEMQGLHDELCGTLSLLACSSGTRLEFLRHLIGAAPNCHIKLMPGYANLLSGSILKDTVFLDRMRSCHIILQETCSSEITLRDLALFLKQLNNVENIELHAARSHTVSGSTFTRTLWSEHIVSRLTKLKTFTARARTENRVALLEVGKREAVEEGGGGPHIWMRKTSSGGYSFIPGLGWVKGEPTYSEFPPCTD